MTIEEITCQIKLLSDELGFSFCGVAKAEALDKDAEKLKQWLQKGYHADMLWMENYLEKRTNPQLLVKDAKSVILVLLNYFPEKYVFENKKIKISRYAFGKDYHKVIKKKLKFLLQRINDEIIPVNGRYFVDSAPLMERALARTAGLGWIGKNSLLLNHKLGSYFFIGSIIVDIELKYDTPINEFCGSCNRCIEACPTQAIVDSKVVDSRKCISYQTIENKGTIPTHIVKHLNGWIFGCDICQEVCPWNKRAIPHKEPSFEPKLALIQNNDWENLSELTYNELFEGSAVKRAGYAGLMRNINSVSKE